jgi:hypothetical protein
MHAWYGATGHEEALNQFLNGKLMYKPTQDNEEGKIDFKISDLKSPFAGKFDLSQCGDASKYLPIMADFREKKPEENKDKVEVWFAPRFLIEKFQCSTAKHFKPILGEWDGKTTPLGLFFTLGSWENLSWYEYVTDKRSTQTSNKNLYVSWWYYSQIHPNVDNATDSTTNYPTIKSLKNFLFIL